MLLSGFSGPVPAHTLSVCTKRMWQHGWTLKPDCWEISKLSLLHLSIPLSTCWETSSRKTWARWRKAEEQRWLQIDPRIRHLSPCDVSVQYAWLQAKLKLIPFGHKRFVTLLPKYLVEAGRKLDYCGERKDILWSQGTAGCRWIMSWPLFPWAPPLSL